MSNLLDNGNDLSPSELVIIEVFGEQPKVKRAKTCSASVSNAMKIEMPLPTQNNSCENLKSTAPPLTYQTKSRAVLYMLINSSAQLGSKIVAARADSGSEENIISFRLYHFLRNKLQVYMDITPERRTFRFANGTTVEALGHVAFDCGFAEDVPPVKLSCTFYVFEKLVTDMIIGMSMLDETETLSKNKHRLTEVSVLAESLVSPVQLCSINNPKRRLGCTVGGQMVMANADTGSDLNLISLTYAQANHLSIAPVSKTVSSIQFAHGEVSWLEGKVTLLVNLGKQGMTDMNVDFYVLKDLTCDLIFGEEFLMEIDAFRTYKDAIEITKLNDFAALDTIIWLGSIERFLARFRLSSDKCAPGTADGDLTTGMC